LSLVFSCNGISSGGPINLIRAAYMLFLISPDDLSFTSELQILLLCFIIQL
jgi:hypothetical protein